MLEQLKAGESIESIAKVEGYDWQVGLSVSRRSQEIDQEITSRVFSMSPSSGNDRVWMVWIFRLSIIRSKNNPKVSLHRAREYRY